MTPPRFQMSDRVVALAGLVQALAQVRRIAETGQADARVLGVSLDSVFRVDAESTEAVYGGREGVRQGLTILRDYFTGSARDEQLPKLAMSVIQLERRFSGEHAMTRKVQEGIRAHTATARERGASDPNVIAALGTLYADTLSHLRPRVLVQGNPHYLGQPTVVAEVRAVLLAAVRSAVLWRQLGGSLWDFLFSRKAMLDAVNQLLR